MKTAFVNLGDLSNEMLSENWILVFGGMGSHSVERASHAVKPALENDFEVLFINPQEENIEQYLLQDPYRGYTFKGQSGTKLISISCFSELQNRPLGKLLALLMENLDSSKSQREGHQIRLLQLLPLSLRRKMTVATSKIHTIFRGLIFWKVVKGQIKKISDGIHPRKIIFCDDDSMTPAWHAAQIWEDAVVVSSWEAF